MHLFTLFLSTLAAIPLTLASTYPPGYLTNFTTLPHNTTLSFGAHYAVINLDLIEATVSGISSTPQGAAFINSTATWINAVHSKQPRPLQIFTRIYFSNAFRPEVQPGSGFANAAAGLGNITASSPASQIYKAFSTDERDVILQKTRYSGGYGNGLEEILRAQEVDTVILSGTRTSGAVLATAYELFDADYNVYIIGDNAIESPSENAVAIDTVIKTGIIPVLPSNVITLKQALAALERSG